MPAVLEIGRTQQPQISGWWHKEFEITGVRGAEQTKDISDKSMLVNNSIRAIPQVRCGLICPKSN
ncbi:MAG: hypothetical protein ACYS6K_18000 [Planctomycetota bacterium]